ncbi:GntR family transcriptional regulator [Amylibacter sp.]|jgi:DNA-binding GntR family transcriptional regulator|nr:GntR family transcriptional regulator [Amylibacter sp.]
MMARTADKLISDIRKEVSSGILKPGDQLEVTALAERFGVSRTPIREAIRTLVESGVLETRPRKGSFVRVLSAKQLLDLFQVAAELEGMACRLAALSLTKENVEAIESGLAKCTQAAEFQNNVEYAMANLDFHTAIHNASGNDWLIEQLRQLQINLNSYRTMPYEIRGRLKKSTDEHKIICDAILSGDGEHACNLMRDHMMLQGKRLPSIIASLEQQKNN